MVSRKIFLDEEDIPKQWYNIVPDLPKPLPPPINSETREPVDPSAVELILAKELIKQEISQERWITIPEEVREVYRIWRPTPLHRAIGLEKALKTPAKIYYKYEGVSPPGSHKANTAVAQAYYNMKQGIERLTTETGAGQWGSALAYGCSMFGLESTIYMVRVSYQQKPYRIVMMENWGAKVFPSPSNNTEFGKRVLGDDPDNTGSIGLATSEALEHALSHENTRYTLGTVLNHVLLHQTVIGQEAIKQFEQIDDYPDTIFGCIGGGSSFSGLFWPFYYKKISNHAPKDCEFVAVEPTACPAMTKGHYMYDHVDVARSGILLKMHTLGHTFIPPPIHAGGLRYHGRAPILSLLNEEGEVGVRAYNQVEVFEAATLFSRVEGIVPAPEPSHAIKATIDEALRCKETGEEKSILFLLCGHGYFDMQAYDDYHSGKLKPYEYPKEKVEKSMKELRTLYPWIDNQ